MLVPVPVQRLERWVENFGRGRTGVRWVEDPGALAAVADDGSSFRAELPFGATFDPALDLDPAPDAALDPAGDRLARFASQVVTPAEWAVLLVRKGGFAVSRMGHASIVEHKIGQRHVQGRTKAGGQSQQRFARRRDNQARAAYEAAAGHAARILAPLPSQALLVTAGDLPAVEEVIGQAGLENLRHLPLRGSSIPDPRRAVLDDVIQRAQCVLVTVHNA